MRDLKIYIPSKGRMTIVGEPGMTLSQFSPKFAKKHVTFVVPLKEVPAYELMIGGRATICGTAAKGISNVRASLIEQRAAKNVLMLDDDMRFYHRPDMDSPKLVDDTSMEEIIQEMLDQFTDKKVAQVGISARQGNNHGTKPWAFNTRCMNVHMFNVDRLADAGVKLRRVEVMEDFDITLQLLRAGYMNAVAYRYAWNQRSSNMAGGCSSYRTAQVQHESAHKLAALHPGFVKVVTKTAKASWEGMQERTDVNIQWQKAFKSSQKGA